MTELNLEANLAKATETTPTKATETKPAPAPVGKKPTKQPIKPPPEGLAVPIAAPTSQPGSPCEVKGCLGRYSTLQTVRDEPKRLRLRFLICRTCMHQPKDPHKSPL